jgi:hypothetical protein
VYLRGAAPRWLRQARKVGLIPLLILLGAGIPFAVYLTSEQSASTVPEVLESTTLPVRSDEPSYGPLPGPAGAPRAQRRAPERAGAGGGGRRSNRLGPAPSTGGPPATSFTNPSTPAAPAAPAPAPAPPAQGGAAPAPREKPAVQDAAPAKPGRGGGGFFDDSG